MWPRIIMVKVGWAFRVMAPGVGPHCIRNIKTVVVVTSDILVGAMQVFYLTLHANAFTKSNVP